ncbi:MAG: hypothetical protein LR011_00830 [Verrucomicrobia bacterium]|nr:hypothetical protein [Verrucomicrobiota bacterium]
MRKTVIDIGTNSVKLLVAEVEDGRVTPLAEESVQTRLGKGLYDSGQLAPDTMAHSLEIMRQYQQTSHALNSQSIRILATSAMRDASNSEEFASHIEQLTGVKVEVISGQDEASLAFLGVQEQIQDPSEPVLVIDVGGGSTEMILGAHHIVHQFCSLPLGSVRCYEMQKIADPPTTGNLDTSRQIILDQINQLNQAQWLIQGASPAMMISTGGTAAAMACMLKKASHLDRETIDNLRLTRQNISEIGQTLWSVDLATRRKIPGIPKKKADILIMGVLIHEVICEFFGVSVCLPSTKGLRYGAMLS